MEYIEEHEDEFTGSGYSVGYDAMAKQLENDIDRVAYAVSRPGATVAEAILDDYWSWSWIIVNDADGEVLRHSDSVAISINVKPYIGRSVKPRCRHAQQML